MSLGNLGPAFPGQLPDTSRADLEAAWPEREVEAALLAANGDLAMAASLRCYALEIRIKVLICQRLNLDYLPRACKTHDLKELIIYTGLWAELNDSQNAAVVNHWKIMTEFSSRLLNVLRYRPNSSYSPIEVDALDDPQDGVLAWLSRPR